MPQLLYDTSMSLDGFITGPDPRPGEPLGDGGEQLHAWMSGIADFRDRHAGSGDAANVNAEVRNALHNRTGAILMGRELFDVGEERGEPTPRSRCRCSSSPTALGAR